MFTLRSSSGGNGLSTSGGSTSGVPKKAKPAEEEDEIEIDAGDDAPVAQPAPAVVTS